MERDKEEEEQSTRAIHLEEIMARPFVNRVILSRVI